MPPTTKRRRVEATPQLLFEALMQLPRHARSRVAALAASSDLPVAARSWSRLLDTGAIRTVQRTLGRVEEDPLVQNLFARPGRGQGADRHEVIATVVGFFTAVSVPGNTGRVLKRFPGAQIRFLEDPIVRVLFPAFCNQYPDLPMGAARFAAIRQKHCPFIRHRGKTPHAGCRYCDDMNLRMRALQSSRAKLACQCSTPAYDGLLAKKFLCPREHNDPWWMYIPCVTGECTKCGFDNYPETKLCSLEETSRAKVEFKAWEATVQNEQLVWKLVPQASLLPTDFWKDNRDFCDRACRKIGHGWLRHVITARVQHEARRELLSKLPSNEVVVGFDFARQYEFYYSNVIANQSFSVSKATILVAYVARKDVNGKVYYETFFFITAASDNNPKKNPALVHHCLGIVFTHLKVGRQMKYVHMFSDGEFKQKAHFAWLGKVAKERKVGMTWNFYAVSHGKDLYDGEGGVLKCSARQHVAEKGTKENNPISTIEELVDFGRRHLAEPKHLAKPSRRDDPHIRHRHFYHVKEKVAMPGEAMQFAGSKAYFAYRTDESGRVQARHFACYCDACLTRTGTCTRPVSPWKDTNTGYLTASQAA